MKRIVPIIFLLVSCNYGESKEPDRHMDRHELSCEQDKYALIWSINTQDHEWKSRYLEYIGDCLEDTLMAIQLAKLDADQGNYNILIHGEQRTLCPFANIHDRYPISFHNPVRVQSDVAEFYNEEVKKLIRKDLQIDLDSVLQREIMNCYLNDSISR